MKGLQKAYEYKAQAENKNENNEEIINDYLS